MGRVTQYIGTKPSGRTRRERLAPASWLSVVDCGAVADGATPCGHAIQWAINRCGDAGGGTVIIPPGQYLSSTIWLRSGVTLHLESGATLIGDANPDNYQPWASGWENIAPVQYAPLIGGEGLQNIAITGRGTIDGRGQFWWDQFNLRKLSLSRPNLIRLVDCRDVLVDGITLINSPRWTLNPTACDNVTITRVTIRNPHDSPNTDGINPDSCANVHISDCHVDVGDDCITVKSGSEDDGRRTRRACQNITITNCTMLHGHGGVVVGSEMSGGVRNIAISNCIFSGTDRGIRLKSRRGRGCSIEDIRVDNIVMDQVQCPIVVNSFYECGAKSGSNWADRSPRPVNDGTPRICRLRFSNVTARRVKYAAAFILGLPEMHVEDVALDNVSIYLDPDNARGGSPAMAPAVPDLCRAGFHITNARNIKLRRVDIHDYLGPALSLENVKGVLVNEMYTHSDRPLPMIQLDGETFEPGGKIDGAFMAVDDRAGYFRSLHLSSRLNGQPRNVTIQHLAKRPFTPANRGDELTARQ